MRRTKRLELRKLRDEQARCAAKFDTLETAMIEHGNGAVKRLRDRMNSSGIHWEKRNPYFSTNVKGSSKKPNSGSQPPKGW